MDLRATFGHLRIGIDLASLSSVTAAGDIALTCAREDGGGGSEPKLLDRIRHELRLRHYSRRTEQAYVRLGQEIRPVPRQASPGHDGGGGRAACRPHT